MSESIFGYQYGSSSTCSDTHYPSGLLCGTQVVATKEEAMRIAMEETDLDMPHMAQVDPSSKHTDIALDTHDFGFTVDF